MKVEKGVLSIKKLMFLLSPAIVYIGVIIIDYIFVAIFNDWFYYEEKLVVNAFAIVSLAVIISTIISGLFYFNAYKKQDDKNTLRFEKVFYISSTIGFIIYAIIIGLLAYFFVYYPYAALMTLLPAIIIIILYILVMVFFSKEINSMRKRI